MRHRRRLVGPIVLLCCALVTVTASRSLRAEARRSANLAKGPYLTALAESGVDVRFELDGASPATVEITLDGQGAGAPRIFEDRVSGAMHVVHATGLVPATPYAYLVRVGGKAVGRGKFTTAPKPESGASLSFLVYGDNRTDPTAHAAIVRALASSSSDFLVNTGDLVEDGGRAEDWQSFFDVEAKLLCERALFVAIGNHELYDDRAGANFARYFGFADRNGALQPYGTVRLSNVRFFFLNAMHDWGSGQERQWLERELDSADREPGIVWRIAVVHQGPWSGGPHGPSPALVDARVPELLAAHGVDLVFSGHDHIYERGDVGGIKYVVSGGGGAPLYRTSRIASTHKAESAYHFVGVGTTTDSIRIVAHRIDGSLIDQCGFKKGGGWDCDSPPALAEVAPVASPTPPAPRCGCTVPGVTAFPARSALWVVAIIALAHSRGRRRRG